MNEVKIRKIYQLHDLFNDFNRLYILIELYKNELSVDEINEKTNIKPIVVFHELEFLVTKKIVEKIEIQDDIKYKISDKVLEKFIGNIKNYVEK